MEKKDKLLPITPIPGNVYAPYENLSQKDIDYLGLQAKNDFNDINFRDIKQVPADVARKTIAELRPDNIKKTWSDINKENEAKEIAFKESQPDSFLEFYNKYVPQPKENKETENSLRRLALAELIQKGIAGMGNVAYAKFGGKNKQWDSQPVSNTYLKSIEAAEQRRKYFDALNHDYNKGMFNVAVEDWKYKKGKEAKAADDEESKRRFDEENERVKERLRIEQQKADDAKKYHDGMLILKSTPKQNISYDITKDRNVVPINVNGEPWYYYKKQWNSVFDIAKKSPSNKQFLNISLDNIDPVTAATMVDRAIGNAVQDGDISTIDALRNMRIGATGWNINDNYSEQKTQTTTNIQDTKPTQNTPTKGTVTKTKSGFNSWTPPTN
jgi:hypothetical protein